MKKQKRKVTKTDLTKLVYKRLDGVIPAALIRDAIDVIFDEMIGQILSGQSLSIDNFGTICHSRNPGHTGFNVVLGEMQYIEPFNQIIFIPHHVFSELISQRKKIFRSNNE